jgi:hypothetical protein
LHIIVDIDYSVDHYSRVCYINYMSKIVAVCPHCGLNFEVPAPDPRSAGRLGGLARSAAKTRANRANMKKSRGRPKGSWVYYKADLGEPSFMEGNLPMKRKGWLSVRNDLTSPNCEEQIIARVQEVVKAKTGLDLNANQITWKFVKKQGWTKP